jgi:hypothetical protein
LSQGSAQAAVAGEERRGLLERLAERINPLVVKEVRQGLRARIFWASFGLMLLACLVISLVAYTTVRDTRFGSHGRGFFFAFFFCLGVVHFLIIPYNAYRSLAREREDETWVLLALTGLGPRRILRGKVASFLVQAGLYAAAAGPFLLFSYYLNGIDLPTILLVLVLGAVWLAFLTVLSVCAATLADGRLGRALVNFLVLMGLMGAMAQGLVAAFALVEEGYRMLRSGEAWLVMGCVLVVMLSYVWLLFETAAARLSLHTENYSRGPRLALVAQMGLGVLLTVGLWLADKQDEDVPLVACILGTVHLAFTGLFVATDLDGQARALRVATRPWSLLRPGALRGLRLVVLLHVAWVVACALLFQRSTDFSSARDHTERMVLLVAPAYSLLYLGLALAAGRLPRTDRLAAPVVVRVLYFCLVGLGGTLPPLLAVLLDLEADHPLLNLLNPFVGLVNFGERKNGEPLMSLEGVAFLWAVALLMVLAADRALAQRERLAHAQ